MVEIAASATALAEVGEPAHGIERPDFEVVPRIGLMIAGVAAVLLIIAIAVNKLWPLEFLHVAAGAGWTIIDLFLGLVLGPIMGRMSLPARVEFTTKLMPKMVVIMPVVVTLTLAAGWQLSTNLGTNLICLGMAAAFPSFPIRFSFELVVASMIVVGVMAVIALGLLEPANIAVLIELKKPRPNPEVIEKLMKRFVYSAGVLGIMQIATLVIMTKLRTG